MFHSLKEDQSWAQNEKKSTKSPCLGPRINKRDRCGSTSLNFFINLEATTWQTCRNNLLKSFEIMWKFLPFALPYLFLKGSFSSTDYIAPINYFLGEIQWMVRICDQTKLEFVFFHQNSFLQTLSTLSNTGYDCPQPKKTHHLHLPFQRIRHHKFTFGRCPQTARAK